MCGREGYSFGSWRSRTSAIWKKPYSTKRLSYKTYRSYRTYKSYRTTFNFSASLIGLQRRLPVYHILFAAPPPAGDFDPNVGWLIVAAVAVVVLLIFLFIFFSFVQLWIQSLLAGAGVGMFDMVRMRLLKLDYGMIVKQKIALVQAGVKASTQELESYLLANGTKLDQVVRAVIAAHKAGMELPWATAAAIQLAGRDIYKAVQ